MLSTYDKWCCLQIVITLVVFGFDIDLIWYNFSILYLNDLLLWLCVQVIHSLKEEAKTV